MTQAAAIAYALLALFPAFVQAALTLGAPWGVLTLGGRYPGKMPKHMRPVTALQCAILLSLAAIALDHGGVIDADWPDWLIWVVVAIGVPSAAANLATPSLPERRLWGPVTVAMLACALVLAFT